MSSSSLISSINATRSTLDGCIQVGLSSKKRLEISSAATAAVSQIEETLSILPKAKFSPTKKALRAVSNTLQGLANGIDRSELSLADVRNSVRNIRDRLSPTLESGFEDISTIAAEGVAVEQAAQAAAEEESLKETKIQHDIETAKDFHSSLRAIKVKLVAEEKERETAIASILDADQVTDAIKCIRKEPHANSRDDASLVQQLEMVREQARDLTAAITKPFQVIKAPIVPIFEASRVENPGNGGAIRPYTTARNFKFDTKLRALGIGHIMLNDYLILTGQMLLAVRSDFVSEFAAEQHQKGNERHKGEKNRVKEWNSKTDPDTIAKLDMQDEQRQAAKELREAERRANRVSKMTPEQYKAFEAEQKAIGKADALRLKKLAKMSPDKKAAFLREEAINQNTEAREVKAEYDKLVAVQTVVEQKLQTMKLKQGYDIEPLESRSEKGGKIKQLAYKGKAVIDPASKQPIRIMSVKDIDDTYYNDYFVEVNGKNVVVNPPPAPFMLDPEYKRLAPKQARLAVKITELKFKLDGIMHSGKSRDIKPVHDVVVPRRTKLEINPSDFASQLLEVLNDTSHVKYELVVKNPIRNPRNPNITLFWVMPSRILLNLQKGAGWGRIKNWGFPL